MADKTKHPLEAIEGVIKVRDAKSPAPKESEEAMRERLIAEMRDRQQIRKIVPPKATQSNMEKKNGK